MPHQFVPYEPRHRAACLAIFDENCPDFFAPNERVDYEAFLDGAGAEYAVRLAEDRVAAAFGVLGGASHGRARLSWILIARDLQGRGIGRTLMTEAIRRAAERRAQWLDIAASHKSAPFFARFGARELQQTLDGWGPGMHRVDMELAIPLTGLTTPNHTSGS